jgi:hypothetical protein
VIAVVGRIDGGAAVPIARRAVREGARVELIATVPDGLLGDAHLAELARDGVGHAAVLRSPASALEAADLELALRYVPDVRVVVVVEEEAGLSTVAADAAAWSGARLILISGHQAAAGSADPSSGTGAAAADAIVLAGPERDPDEAFAGLVARLAARLDGGEDPGVAWRQVLQGVGLERVSPGGSAREPGPSGDPPA